jgi:quercetin dioxygenase-like cupin family protein
MTMSHKTKFAAAAALSIFACFAQAQDSGNVTQANSNWKTGIQRTDLSRHDLDVSGREVIQARVDFAPGVASPNHSHPGVEVAFVISGTFEYQLEGRAPIILKAGESLFIPAGTAHIATNIGESTASELATYIVKKGEPLLHLEE